MFVERLWIGLIVVTLMSYSRVVSVALALSGVGLQTLIFFHPSLSVIQQKKKKKKKKKKKIELVVHT